MNISMYYRSIPAIASPFARLRDPAPARRPVLDGLCARLASWEAEGGALAGEAAALPPRRATRRVVSPLTRSKESLS